MQVRRRETQAQRRARFWYQCKHAAALAGLLGTLLGMALLGG
jgi:hypothetical protein